MILIACEMALKGKQSSLQIFFFFQCNFLQLFLRDPRAATAAVSSILFPRTPEERNRLSVNRRSCEAQLRSMLLINLLCCSLQVLVNHHKMIRKLTDDGMPPAAA